MADLQKLERALINADKAGDTAAATILAREIKSARAAQQQPESAQSEVMRKELSKMSNIEGNPNIANAVAENRRIEYNDLPGWQKPLVAADDIVRLLADGITFGFLDKALGPEERAKTQAAVLRAGAAALPAQIMGSVITGTGAMNSGLTLAGKAGTAGLTGAKGALARAAVMAPESAAYGALDAKGHDQDVTTGALIGAVAGPLGSLAGDALSAGLSKVSSAVKGSPKVPDLSALKADAKAAYDQADNAGVIIRPEGMKRLTDNIKTDLADAGYHPKIQPRIAAVLEELDNATNGNITLKGVDVIRRIADNARKSTDPSEKMLGNQLIRQIDDFVENMQPSDILAGDALRGAAALKKARSLWTRVSKNERLLKSIDKAENRAASTHAGTNIENASRQNLRRELENGRGYTPDERAALKDIVRGTPGQNAARFAGKMAPTGIVSGGMGVSLGTMLGAAIAGPPGAAVGAVALPAIGQISKMMADKGVRDGVQALQVLVRSGGDAAALQAAQGAIAKLTEAQRQAVSMIVRSGVIQGVRDQQPSK